MTGRKNHQWLDPRVVIAQESPDGCERHVRKCVACGLIKTTIGQPDGKWRVEYQTIEDGPVSTRRPECSGLAPRPAEEMTTT